MTRFISLTHFSGLEIVLGHEKLSSASKICPRRQGFVLGLGLGLENSSSLNITGR